MTVSVGYLLTFELSKTGDELEVHFDRKGLIALRKVLDRIEKGEGHEHLLTAAWGGHELSEEKQESNSTLLNKVTFRLW